MKKNYLMITLIFIIIIFIIIFLINIINDKMLDKIVINSIEYLKFNYNEGNSYFSDAYYIVNCNDSCELTIKRYMESEEHTNTLKKADIKKTIELLNKYKIVKWNNFNKSDNSVLDGNAFSLYIKYNNEKNISANGYMRYPENYKGFKDSIIKLFDKIANE